MAIYSLIVASFITNNLLNFISASDELVNTFDLNDLGNSSRKKRALYFPEGSNFVMTIQMLKGLEISQPKTINLDYEFDVTWPIPNNAKSSEKPISRHRRHRRELYDNLELAFNRQNFPGRLCVLRSICEVKVSLSLPGASLVEDLLRVVLTYPNDGESKADIYDNAYHNNDNCAMQYRCPFSILDLLLSYDIDD